MNRALSDYQLILLDMDGTLYFQRPLQLHMGIKMLSSCLSRQGLKEILIILRFRRQRERWNPASHGDDRSDLDSAQYAELARQFDLSPDEIEHIVKKWIYQKPLALLNRYRDKTLAQIVLDLKAQGRTLAIYSDYPAQDKRDALHLPPIPCFYGGQKEIAAMKPDPKGILTIMSHFHTERPQDVLMIGDRASRDGLAASSAGADFLILKKHKWQRKKQYKLLLPKQ